MSKRDDRYNRSPKGLRRSKRYDKRREQTAKRRAYKARKAREYRARDKRKKTLNA